MSAPIKRVPIAETITPSLGAAVSSEVRAWQVEKIKAGLEAADEGRFASPEDVRTVIQKYIPNG